MKEDFTSKEHNHSEERQSDPMKRNEFNYCLTCKDWYKPIARATLNPAKCLIFAALALMPFAASDATTSRKSKIEMIYKAEANGDYRLFLFGSDRTLVCEEKPLKIVQQGDAVNPVIIECKHAEAPARAHKAHVAGCWFHHGSGVPDTRLPDSDCRVKN